MGRDKCGTCNGKGFYYEVRGQNTREGNASVWRPKSRTKVTCGACGGTGRR
jgi:uncharacterized protein YpmB